VTSIFTGSFSFIEIARAASSKPFSSVISWKIAGFLSLKSLFLLIISYCLSSSGRKFAPSTPSRGLYFDSSSAASLSN